MVESNQTIYQEIPKNTTKYAQSSSDLLTSNKAQPYFMTSEISKTAKIPNPNHNPNLIDNVLNTTNANNKSNSNNTNNSSTLTDNSKWDNLMDRPKNAHEPGNFNTLEYTTHNNMQPFFRGNATQNMDIDNKRNGYKLEQFTGKNKLLQKDKHEIPILFNPEPENIHGLNAPRQPERFKNSSMHKNGEKPFYQEYVTPGTNIGYNIDSTHGLHDPTRVLPKTTDERSLNPKTQYDGRVIRGKTIGKRGIIGETFVNKPKVLVTNENGERNFTTVGENTKGPIRGIKVLKATNRKHPKEHIGNVLTSNGSVGISGDIARIMKQPSKKRVETTPHRNAYRSEGKNHHDEIQHNYERRDTERAIHGVAYGEKGYNMSNVNPDVDKHKLYMFDDVKHTKKQDFIDNYNPNGYFNAQNHEGGLVYDKDTVTPKTTHQETYEDYENYGQMNSQNHEGGVVYDKDTIIPKTTHQETYEDYENYGQMNSQNHEGGVVYDKDTIIPKTTNQETYEDHENYGQMNSQNHEGGVVYDNDTIIPKTTNQETYEDYENYGQMNSQNHEGGVVYDNDTITPKTTHHETYVDKDHIGMVGTKANSNGAYISSEWDVKNTKKQFLSDHEYTGNAKATDTLKHKAYDNMYNLRQNTMKEIVAKGRAPKGSNVNLPIGVDNINMRLKSDCDLSQRYNKYLGSSDVTYMAHYKPLGHCDVTNYKIKIPNDNRQYDPDVLNLYKGNELTQSLNAY
jgi:hypothetical protein